MSSDDNSGQRQRPLRLLSLDGGGVRGLSTIMILKYLMSRICGILGRKVDPWEVFDLIGGTSTGGILAVMLGRLRMSIHDCERAYLTLSEKIFTPRRNSGNYLGRGKDFLQANGRFDAEVLHRVIKDTIKECKMSEDELFKEMDAECKVFVCAALASNSSPALLRSYQTTLPELLYDECKIWEACAATSAAPTFFDGISIGPYNQIFVDGAILYNNPIQLLYQEAEALWPDRIQDAQIVSIGTGSAPGQAFEGNIGDIVRRMADLVVQTERTANDFQKGHKEMVEQGLLYRFNVYHGLAEIGLEEYREKGRIANATHSYLTHGEVLVKTTNCVKLLSGSKGDAAVIYPSSAQPTQSTSRVSVDSYRGGPRTSGTGRESGYETSFSYSRLIQPLTTAVITFVSSAAGNYYVSGQSSQQPPPCTAPQPEPSSDPRTVLTSLVKTQGETEPPMEASPDAQKPENPQVTLAAHPRTEPASPSQIHSRFKPRDSEELSTLEVLEPENSQKASTSQHQQSNKAGSKIEAEPQFQAPTESNTRETPAAPSPKLTARSTEIETTSVTSKQQQNTDSENVWSTVFKPQETSATSSTDTQPKDRSNSDSSSIGTFAAEYRDTSSSSVKNDSGVSSSGVSSNQHSTTAPASSSPGESSSTSDTKLGIVLWWCCACEQEPTPERLLECLRCHHIRCEYCPIGNFEAMSEFAIRSRSRFR